MKVLQINTVCGSGSVGKITVDIYETLRERGEEAVIFYGRDQASGNVEGAVKIGSKLDFYLHAFLGVALGKGGFGSRKYTQQMIERIKKEKPDVIHLHNIHGFYLQIEVLFEFLKKAGIPVVWTFHDCWPFTGHCAYFDYSGCDKWKTGCIGCANHIKAYPYSIRDYAKQSFFRKTKAFLGVENLTIVTPSYWLADLVKKSFLKEYPTQVIPNGIDLEKFHPQVLTPGSKDQKPPRERYGIGKKYMILGVANVWEERKGMEYFIKLNQLLAKEGESELNSDNTVIVLVGLSKKQKKNLPSKMIGIERTNGVEELAALYTAADVYVNATLEDNFPTTNLEALACGTPVITFATGGSMESIDDSCGIVTKRKDEYGILESLKEMKKHPRTSQACVRKGEEYDRKKRFLEYIELYEKVVE